MTWHKNQQLDSNEKDLDHTYIEGAILFCYDLFVVVVCFRFLVCLFLGERGGEKDIS